MLHVEAAAAALAVCRQVERVATALRSRLPPALAYSVRHAVRGPQNIHQRIVDSPSRWKA